VRSPAQAAQGVTEFCCAFVHLCQEVPLDSVHSVHIERERLRLRAENVQNRKIKIQKRNTFALLQYVSMISVKLRLSPNLRNSERKGGKS
jgi:hypothetical protein